MADEDDRGLFETTRGKLLLLLCQRPQTVNELSEALGLTDNAVRVQLLSLQQAGFVQQVGLRPGVRRPHVDYELTAKARRLFPRAHEPVLNVLVDVLRERLSPQEMAALMKDVARRMCSTWVGESPRGEPRRRMTELFARLRGLTAGLTLDQSPSQATLRACGCPLGSVTASHPEVCRVLAEVLSEIVGTEARECCDRNDGPRCRFELNFNSAK